MTKISGFRNIFINLGIILFFIVLSYAYLSPLLEGKALQMPDIEHHKGMSKELVDYREKTGEEAIWTNSMFGGMPGYMISVIYPGNLCKYVNSGIRQAFSTAALIFLYLLGFYILLLSLNINRWLSVVGAVAFAFSSYFIIILGAGHMSKANAIGYMAPVIAGVLLAFKGKHFAGTLLFTTAFSLELLSGHLQITYYGAIMIALFGLVEFIYAIKKGKILAFCKTLLFLVAGAVVAVGMNFSRLYTAYEYSKDTIRGPSELKKNRSSKTRGLDKDYVVQWSYGIDETMTILIPNFKGGGSQVSPGVNSKCYNTLKTNRVKNPEQVVKAVSMYHGDQPGTAGPVYIGAIIVFLFIFGLFVVKGPIKWWLLISTIVSIVLSWGGNIMWLTSFLLDYLPFYNKFRAPSMTLVIAQAAMPLLGIIALNEVINGKVKNERWVNAIKKATVISAGIPLLLMIFPSIAGDYICAFDRYRFPEWLMDSVIADRKDMLRSDAFRSLLLIILASGTIYFWSKKKIKTVYLIGIIGVLVLVDLWTVDKRYLNNDSFVPKRQAKVPFPKMPADKAILKDKNLYYRVLPLQNPFQDARTSYYHKNVGGYHAAKLRRYQDLIDYHIQPEIQILVKGLKDGLSIDSIFDRMPIVNMLNTKYLIYDLNSNPIVNKKALGNAWFVSDYKIVNDADDEIYSMKNFNPEQEAVIDKKFIKHLDNVTINKDENGVIELIDYKPNCLKYNYRAEGTQLAVFSDIYYNKGWNAYIDGERVSHFRVNYVLRAMVIPEGEHAVEFKFEPVSYYKGNKVSIASSLLLIFAIIGYGISYVNRRRKRNQKKE